MVAYPSVARVACDRECRRPVVPYCDRVDGPAAPSPAVGWCVRKAPVDGSRLPFVFAAAVRVRCRRTHKATTNAPPNSSTHSRTVNPMIKPTGDWSSSLIFSAPPGVELGETPDVTALLPPSGAGVPRSVPVPPPFVVVETLGAVVVDTIPPANASVTVRPRPITDESDSSPNTSLNASVTPTGSTTAGLRNSTPGTRGQTCDPLIHSCAPGSQSVEDVLRVNMSTSTVAFINVLSAIVTFDSTSPYAGSTSSPS
mmetsp:Transcript_5266/g.16936  ORF Transcript_5266/g.16936 Transcript_5266/m.16936 type:complete len:255 (-) Transcript_5266:393-1157(-)